ncbi:phosphoribosylformylglycinamidine cyclo-ligase [Fimbriiglobus ruber]|uniref:Phosphoribosylformylglycinamidine cyclo-ligase n=1 Tax=Fimbriiglobus ruber TaxID=1908690 RepID=A0A225DAG8_9BACT|nr:phosphoribosylformylglycinamidine cyclo-ligase [Fimbriiglobus ruber]OWK35538.1 Phosphoribosylformylglycinamidine cyclo-ligase [Fimbriiglobus ruber]
MSDEGWDYKKAGLDLEKYAETMSGIQPLLARTWDTARVFPPPFPPRKGGKGSGGFASLFDINPDGRYKNPVLVTCTDGVGSKLKIARQVGKFDTVGIDLVAMSVNDLICTGGEPLVFLDYIAMPADDPDLTKQLVKGISDGCVQAGCSLVGGETAILPDFYAPGDFDTAGFCAGVVERDRVIDGRAIRAGDALIGLASSGIHSNGYSLVRKIVDAAGLSVSDHVPDLGTTVGAALLEPTRIYVKPIRAVVAAHAVTGLANITGGGVPDNLGRILPPGKRAVIRRGTWPVLPVFTWLQKLGRVAQPEMDRVFNGGIGFVVAAPPAEVDGMIARLSADGVPAWVIGEIRDGETGVEIV